MNDTSRRDFIKLSASAAAATFAAQHARHAHAADSNETLKVGLIGCGGRGTGAAVQALNADPQTKLVALADAFPDRVEDTLKKLKSSPVKDRVQVDPEHRFSGFNAYQGVIDSCDVVLLCATPAFRPKHLKAAIEAGKHVFCEKPIAVDGPGVRSVLETSKLAKKKNVNLVSGLCYRYQFAKRDVVDRIHDGAVGELLALQTTYNTGTLWHRGKKESWSEMEYQIRNWLYFDWLSGDHITEQHIHSLDKVAWAMNGYPVKATASGGRSVRTDEKYGNIYDHFNTVYEWENGVRCFSSCRQWGDSATDVSDYVYGTKGVAELQSHTIKGHSGKSWKHEPTGPDDMYQNEHNELFAAIRSGDTINNGEYMCGSTLMAIMGRLSAYTGQTVTRDQILNSKEVTMPAKLEWADAPQRAIARPGETKLA